MRSAAALRAATLLAVFGPSGSGKSSLLRAGLLPALASGVLPGSDRWRQVEDLFHSVRELPQSERESFLARACAGDTALMRELIEAHTELSIDDRKESA